MKMNWISKPRPWRRKSADVRCVSKACPKSTPSSKPLSKPLSNWPVFDKVDDKGCDKGFDKGLETQLLGRALFGVVYLLSCLLSISAFAAPTETDIRRDATVVAVEQVMPSVV